MGKQTVSRKATRRRTMAGEPAANRQADSRETNGSSSSEKSERGSHCTYHPLHFIRARRMPIESAQRGRFQQRKRYSEARNVRVRVSQRGAKAFVVTELRSFPSLNAGLTLRLILVKNRKDPGTLCAERSGVFWSDSGYGVVVRAARAKAARAVERSGQRLELKQSGLGQ